MWYLVKTLKRWLQLLQKFLKYPLKCCTPALNGNTNTRNRQGNDSKIKQKII